MATGEDLWEAEESLLTEIGKSLRSAEKRIDEMQAGSGKILHSQRNRHFHVWMSPMFGFRSLLIFRFIYPILGLWTYIPMFALKSSSLEVLCSLRLLFLSLTSLLHSLPLLPTVHLLPAPLQEKLRHSSNENAMSDCCHVDRISMMG